MTQIGLRIADSPNTLPQPAEGGDTVDLSRLLTAVRRRRAAILWPVALWVVLGAVYQLTTPKTYTASSTLLLDAGASAMVRELAAMESGTLPDVAIENARLVIRSDVLAADVAAQLALQENDSFLNPPQSLASELAGGVLGLVRLPLDAVRWVFRPSATGSQAEADLLQDRVIRELSGRIGVERLSRSGGVSVYFRSHDPALAAGIVNAYSDAYIADTLNAKFESTERTTEWLQGRLSDLESAAAEAAAAAETFRAENGLMSSDGRFMSEDSVSRLNLDLSEAIAEAATRRALVEGFEQAVARGVDGLLSGAQVGTGPTPDPALEELQSNLSSAVSNLNRITASFGADHPQAQLMAGEVDAAAERLFVGVQQRLERARGDYSVAQARVAALRESLGTAMGDTAASGSAQVQLRALEQRAETLSVLYQTFLTQFQEIDQQKDFPITDVRILSRAEVPQDADGPRASRVLAVTLVIGLIFGTIIAAILEWRDRFLRTGDDVTVSTGLRFIGYLPDMSEAVRKPFLPARVQKLREMVDQLVRRVLRTPPEDMPAAALNQAIYSETLQAVRLGLTAPQAGGRENGIDVRRAREITSSGSRQVLGITSVRPGEGKSTLALDLASTLAASGTPVLLIDADMRRSGLSRGLGFTKGPSLVDVARGEVAWTKALRKCDLPSLDVLPCIWSHGLAHATELLASKQIQDLLSEARRKYAHIIIDLAPLGPVVDARVLFPALDQVLMVATWGTTPKTLLRSVVADDPALADRMLGVVLNRVDMVALRDYLDRTSIDAYVGDYSDYRS